jgi:PIN domain nuclease of toxin-antitoxin system
VTRLLLDTHVFLWYITADPKLPESFRVVTQDASNVVFLSSISVWEAVIKQGLGKLTLPALPAAYLPQQRVAHGIAALPVDEGAMAHLAELPSIHRDPFDRLLIAQAMQHELTLMTVDRVFNGYPVQLLDVP